MSREQAATRRDLAIAARLAYTAFAMRFLTTLFWILVAAFLIILAGQNWNSVTVNLWGDLQMDIKLPVLILLVFLVGFLPTWLILRGRIWQLRRRLDAQEQIQQIREADPEAGPAAPDAETKSPAS